MTDTSIEFPAGPDLTKPFCYYVDPCQDPGERGFIPSLVVAGESGHRPMIGSGKFSSPWYWGKTLEEAEATCERVNAKRGIDAELASAIVASSMFLNPTTLKRAYALAKSAGALA